MKTVFVIAGLFSLVINKAFGQDPVYSIYWNDKTMMNPARLAESGGMYFTMHHRMQWPAIISRFNTYSFSAEQEIPAGPNNSIALGLRGSTNVEGEGFQKTNDFTLMASYRATLTRKFQFLAGIGLGYIIRSVDPNKLVFSDQIDPVLGIVNPTSANLELIERGKAPNTSFGVTFRGLKGKGRKNLRESWQLGIGVHHGIPGSKGMVTLSLLDNSKYKLPPMFAVNLDTRHYFGSSNGYGGTMFTYRPAVFFTYQKPHNGNGMGFQTFRIGNTMTFDKISTGIFYKNEKIYDLATTESIILTFAYKYRYNRSRALNMYYAYDATISKLTTGGGVHEIGISYEDVSGFLFGAIGGGKGRYRGVCPTF